MTAVCLYLNCGPYRGYLVTLYRGGLSCGGIYWGRKGGGLEKLGVGRGTYCGDKWEGGLTAVGN